MPAQGRERGQTAAEVWEDTLRGCKFIELHRSEDQRSPAIYKYVIRLNEPVRPSDVIIGNSRIHCEGTTATWYFLEHH